MRIDAVLVYRNQSRRGRISGGGRALPELIGERRERGAGRGVLIAVDNRILPPLFEPLPTRAGDAAGPAPPIGGMAPGWPGIEARWTSSAKEGVGTALTSPSRVWFTLSHGILNEVYYPRIDEACTRDLGLIVTDGDGFFSEEKRHTRHEVRVIESGVPAFELVNTCLEGRYRIVKRVITDPKRDVLLQKIRFEPLRGEIGDYRLFALLAPHLVNAGAHNTAWVGDYKGMPVLYADGAGSDLAMICAVPWRAASAGFVGTSDGWQVLCRHGYLAERWQNAGDGNVALTGEIDLRAGGEVTIALGFGHRPAEAAFRALASLQDGFDPACNAYVEGWRAALDRIVAIRPYRQEEQRNLYRTSVGVMLAHEPASFPGGIIASLSVPWGFEKGDNDLGGYHLIWPRDLVQTAGGLLAAGLVEEACAVLTYLQAVQEADGRWPQNMWLDGTPYWAGVQLDECAFPILLVDLVLRHCKEAARDPGRFVPMVESAAAYIVANGPVTGQDRWEEDPGYSTFTLAVTVSALLVAAGIIGRVRGGDDPVACYLRETADAWNERIEDWTYATDTDLARAVGVDGYYVRIAPPAAPGASPLDGSIRIKNRPPGADCARATDIVSPDALALVRFGLRAADDPRIVNTVKVIDHLLKSELPQGPVWRRYNEDGYGEHEDGRAFDGTGIGRPWPLLVGERAHYELAAGRRQEVRRLVAVFEACANDGGLLPEQVWDADDIPERELFRGRASGSAMPLVWAHAEYVKLLRSLRDRSVFDMPPESARRYQIDRVAARVVFWRPDLPRRSIPPGRVLRIELPEPVLVHWTRDHWQSAEDVVSRDSGLRVHFVDLPTADLAAGTAITFTFRRLASGQWAGEDYRLVVGSGA